MNGDIEREHNPLNLTLGSCLAISMGNMMMNHQNQMSGALLLYCRCHFGKETVPGDGRCFDFKGNTNHF